MGVVKLANLGDTVRTFDLFPNDHYKPHETFISYSFLLDTSGETIKTFIA